MRFFSDLLQQTTHGMKTVLSSRAQYSGWNECRDLIIPASPAFGCHRYLRCSTRQKQRRSFTAKVQAGSGIQVVPVARQISGFILSFALRPAFLILGLAIPSLEIPQAEQKPGQPGAGLSASLTRRNTGLVVRRARRSSPAGWPAAYSGSISSRSQQPQLPSIAPCRLPAPGPARRIGRDRPEGDLGRHPEGRRHGPCSPATGWQSAQPQHNSAMRRPRHRMELRQAGVSVPS